MKSKKKLVAVKKVVAPKENIPACNGAQAYLMKVERNKLIIQEYLENIKTVPEIAKQFGLSERHIRDIVTSNLPRESLRSNNLVSTRIDISSLNVPKSMQQNNLGIKGEAIEDMSNKILAYLKKKKNKNVTYEELSNYCDRGVNQIKVYCDDLANKGYNIVIENNNVVSIPDNVAMGGKDKVIDLKTLKSKQYKVGAIADTHLCSSYSREDILQTAYNDFEKNGISDVYHVGNMIDGESKFNKTDLLVPSGVERQMEYLVNSYPQRKGIKTHFITGECHEGWYNTREGMNIGRIMQDRFEDAGRSDMEFLGHMESDIVFKSNKGESRMRLSHPGDGTAYALSYAPQKIVESMQGGAKPQILLLGHYHKQGYFLIRNVNVILVPSTLTQTPWMRKKHISSEIGYVMLTITLDEFGGVSSILPEFTLFYDEDYYDKKWEHKLFKGIN